MVTKYSSDELHDESKRVCDIQPYFCIFRIISKQVSENNKLTKSINCLIGKSLNDFKVINNAEINDFRYKMTLVADDYSQKRRGMTWADKMLYQYPPRLASTPEISDTVKTRLRNDHFVLVAKFHNNEISSFTFNVLYSITPLKMIEMVLNKKALTTNAKSDRISDYILKVCGQDEYLFGDHPLIQFHYVQDTLSRDGVPTLIMKPIKDVEVFRENTHPIPREFRAKKQQQSTTSTLRKKGKQVSSWDIDLAFRCTINTLKDLNIGDESRNVEIGVQVGLFHGGKSLCEPQRTTEKPLSSQRICSFEEELVFNLNVMNVPRMTRLCLVVYEVAKGPKNSSGTKSRRLKELNKVISSPNLDSSKNHEGVF